MFLHLLISLLSEHGYTTPHRREESSMIPTNQFFPSISQGQLTRSQPTLYFFSFVVPLALAPRPPIELDQG